MKKIWIGLVCAFACVIWAEEAPPNYIWALGAASSAKAGQFGAYAVDTLRKTAWQAETKGEEWLEIDLHEPMNVESLRLIWKWESPADYKIQTADERGGWRDAELRNRIAKISGTVSNVAATANLNFRNPVNTSKLRILIPESGDCAQPPAIFDIMVNNKRLFLGGPMPDGPIPPADAPYRNAKLSPEVRAKDLVGRMTLAEKVELIGSKRVWGAPSFKRLGLAEVIYCDASQGIHYHPGMAQKDYISYPSMVALAATFNKEIAVKYGESLGTEARAWGFHAVLGPGINLYRNSLCGRNFEYMGEDPLLAGEMAAGYINGMQSQGVMATPKHYLGNNHEWLRHISNSQIGDRAMHELYLEPWRIAVEKSNPGAVMTAYNLVNGEKASQSKVLITDLLKNELGFQGCVMSDWGAVTDGVKALRSGLDQCKPVNSPIWGAILSGGMSETEINECTDRMAFNTLKVYFRFGFYDRPQTDESFRAKIPQAEQVCLEAGREAVVLLKNDGILPLANDKAPIYLVGKPSKHWKVVGAGSGLCFGYGHKLLRFEMTNFYDGVVMVDDLPNEDKIKRSKYVIYTFKLDDSEGRDGVFELPAEVVAGINTCIENNPNTIVVAFGGRGFDMEPWHNKVPAIIHALYPGQYHGQVVAEILAGKVNPSGRLPFTIEKSFRDSPAYGYNDRTVPEWFDAEQTSTFSRTPDEIVDFEYTEGILIGYRWYDAKKLDVRYPFGYGLSYTTFEYSDLKAEPLKNRDGTVSISGTVTVHNTGTRAGSDVVQIYITDDQTSVERPVRELAAFDKVVLSPDEKKTVSFTIGQRHLSFYSPEKKNWVFEPGSFTVAIGASSRDIKRTVQVQFK